LKFRSIPPCRYALFAVLPFATACGPSVGAQSPSLPPVTSQWFERAKVSFRSGDFDDAWDSSRKALAGAPADDQVREFGARVALARLDYAEALRLTDSLESSNAHSIRGRAHWLAGDVEQAADELEALLADPEVKDPWARDVAGLARRGVGRHPFSMDGASIGAVEMPTSIDRVPLGAESVVPCELDGERVLALVATGSSEVVLDSNSRHDASWVSLRFDHLEIGDVPALVQDLSPLARQLGVPIKALLGAQLLRHAHATFDRRGDQFVVRRRDAAAPPDASRVPLYYLRGGGMVLRASVGARNDALAAFYVDSVRPFPLVLQDAAWQTAGIDPRSLSPLPDNPGLRHGVLPILRFAGFDLAKLPAIEGLDMGDLTKELGVDLAGIVGADLLAFFRVTFDDDGRFIWVEPDPTLISSPSPPAVSSSTSAPAGDPGDGSPPAAARRE
jgi:hypothetical protein